MITNIHCVPVVISDYDRALRFFRDALGFEVTADVVDPRSSDNRWLTLKPVSGQTQVMLLKPSANLPEIADRVGRPTYLVLSTDNIEAACERVKSHGGRILVGPKRAGWGSAAEAQFSDPDGNTFMLVQFTDA